MVAVPIFEHSMSDQLVPIARPQFWCNKNTSTLTGLRFHRLDGFKDIKEGKGNIPITQVQVLKLF
jgi:hypothetical protein